jgi:dUTPase/5'-deoxynucleotidase YfbR-like HD superfamily hydrolase
MVNELEHFINDFNIVDNAMDMRTLIRWNGRDLRCKENLAEHTHLVVACVIELYDKLKSEHLTVPGGQCYLLPELVDFESLIRRCMLHDSLELFRGDILSITKDAVPGLRSFTDSEENDFMRELGCLTNSLETELVELADLMACYKFIEHELRYPSNDFARDVYIVTKNKFDEKYKSFCRNYDIVNKPDVNDITSRFKKGYAADAGVDVILDRDVLILPMSTAFIDLNITVTPEEGEMAVLCARTSSAAKGLCVAMCPIDAHYTGNVTAIVHNVSNQILNYKKGEAFCQVVSLPITSSIPKNLIEVKKPGKRSAGKLGSTGI